MKHGKKLLSIFLGIVMLLGLLPGTALAAEGLSGNITTDQTWNSSTTFSSEVTLKDVTITVDGTVTVTKKITIPADSTVTIVGENNGKLLISANGMYINKKSANLTLKDITVDATSDVTASYLINVGNTERDETAKIVFENAIIGRGKKVQLTG